MRPVLSLVRAYLNQIQRARRAARIQAGQCIDCPGFVSPTDRARGRIRCLRCRRLRQSGETSPESVQPPDPAA